MTAQSDHFASTPLSASHGGQEPDAEIDFDTPAKSGWVHFSKFLFWNVLAAAAILIFIGFLTVWR